MTDPKVVRYWMDPGDGPCCEGRMEPMEDGPWVEYDDYARLAGELEKARETNKKLNSRCQSAGESATC